MQLRLLLLFVSVGLGIVLTAQPAAVHRGAVEMTDTEDQLSLRAQADGSLRVNVPPAMTERLVSQGVVAYHDFGATDDDESDDANAIAATHAFANQHGLPVRAEGGAVYHLSGKRRTAIILTDTDFGDAQFIIDDRAVEDREAPLFIVGSRLQPFPLKGITTLKRGQRKIKATLPGPCLITAENKAVKHYIRFGRNQNKGKPQTDIFVVDRKGRVDADAPIIWDFDRISKLTARPIDEKPLHLTGGLFTTIANQEPSRYNYYARNIEIQRSNVIVDGIEHRITGEGDTGAPYRGFIHVRDCAYVTIKNALLTGHKTYQTIGSAGVPVPMGSYDFSAGRALNVSLVNCRQTNSIQDRNYWGIMASNYCKNLRYEGCALSRFDAHMGVANVVIRDSELGHMGIKAIGGGTLRIENSTVYARNLITLRPDYGSTWNGVVVIKDCTLAPPGGLTAETSVLGGHNSGRHDFGYVCYLPQKVIIDGLRIKNESSVAVAEGKPAVFATFQPSPPEGQPLSFPFVPPRKVVLRNISVAGSQSLRVSNNDALFKDVKVVRR